VLQLTIVALIASCLPLSHKPLPQHASKSSSRHFCASHRSKCPDQLKSNAKTASRFEDLTQAIKTRVNQSIANGDLPGCVIAFGTKVETLWTAAYGDRSIVPIRLPMQKKTIFDIASLSKPIATAMSIMVAIDRGILQLDDRVSKYIDEFHISDKQDITVKQLLLHTSDLPSVIHKTHFETGIETAFQEIVNKPLKNKPGTVFKYSDIGYILLGEIVRRATGTPLNTFAADNIFHPLDMQNTMYTPPVNIRKDAAPTEFRDQHIMQGEVHDPLAYRLGGVAGNAGVFSTILDIARFGKFMLSRGRVADRQIIAPELLDKMTSPYDVGDDKRGLGWDIRTRYSKHRSSLLSDRAYGHGGFTGTALWIDPESDFFFAFLSNRVHPNGKGYVHDLVRDLTEIIIQYQRRNPKATATTKIPESVDLGVDRLLTKKQQVSFKGKRVALITNQAARLKSGQTSLEALSKRFNIVRVFTPEHGFSAQKEGEVNIQALSDRISVVSLYGKHRKPSSNQLQDIDVVLFDLQDAGVRYFTYGSTLRSVLEAVATASIPIIVLDRPNPLGGLRIDGPMLTENYRSFVNYHDLPIQHGMTIGELAWMLNRENNIGAQLSVIRMKGWHRNFRFKHTGLDWTAPSPNLRTLDQVDLYPAVGLLEGTNLSVGRGTTMPFEFIGAPWLHGRDFAASINRAGIDGLSAEEHIFIPSTAKFKGQQCYGVKLRLIVTEATRPVLIGLTLAQILHRLHPKEWNTSRLVNIIGDISVVDRVLNQQNLSKVARSWEHALQDFNTRRKRYLMYD